MEILGVKDRWHIVQLIVILQGLAAALPWNVYVTEAEFFTLRVHIPPYNRVLADNFENVNLLTSQAANVLGFLIYVPCQACMSMEAQVLYPQMLTLGIMASGAWLSLSLWLGGNAVALVTLGSQVLIGLTNATIQGGVYAMAAWLPPLYLQGMSLGIGMSGFLVAIISFVTIWWVPPADRSGSHVKTPAEAAPEAFLYFVLSSITIAAAIVTYFVFFRMRYVRAHRQPQVLAEWEWHSAGAEPIAKEVCSSSAAGSNGSEDSDLEQLLLLSQAPSPVKAPAPLPACTGVHDSSLALPEEQQELSLWQIMYKMTGYNIVAFLNLFVTSAAFPGLTSAICSQFNSADIAPCNTYSPQGRFFGDLFVPFMFLVFNGGDFIGRLLAGLEPWRSRPPPMGTLIAYSALRGLVVIGLVFCNVVTPSPWQLPVLLRGDVWPIALTLIHGITNGHTQSLAFMHAPSCLPRGPARERCGPLINLALAVGCTVGSIIAFYITYTFQQD